ncbi:MAG: hypothetical protein JEZ09_06995 [Salinivirgaceae bacterium]|nr:hypothetical protein [Salinivirgaceae bacterium]
MFLQYVDINALKRKHRYYYRSGFYWFLTKNILKIIGILLLIIALFLVLEKWVVDKDKLFSKLFHNLNNAQVFALFVVSESFFGLIPPDFFIIWGRKFDHPWQIVTLLGFISYGGGIISYKIGLLIRSIKKLNVFLTKKFKQNFRKVRRWGSVFIVVAALFPLPYSTICMLSGILKYPFKIFLYIGLIRVLRFYLYALVLYGLLK